MPLNDQSLRKLISFRLYNDAMTAIQLETTGYLSYFFLVMRSVEEIEAEIAKLNPLEVRQIGKWLAEYEAKLWDRQIGNDAADGKLDRFVKEAFKEYRKGNTRPLP